MSLLGNHVSICVCTFKRPEFLENLLLKLAKQETGGQFSYSVVVVDNDVGRSAERIVELCRSRLNVELHYYVEPEQNISLARNKAVTNATGDWVAFIDDDEFPEPGWLLQLRCALLRSGASGVLGPVNPFFRTSPPRWVLKARLFDRPSLASGLVLKWTQSRTGNALIRKSVFADLEGPFRKEFGSGGEDRDFFKRAMEKGHTFVWCQEAAVSEIIPPQRWQRSVLLKRALLRGKASLASPSFGSADLIKSAIAALAYTLALPLFFVCGQHVFMPFLIKNCDHLGKLLAACGINPVREKYVTT